MGTLANSMLQTLGLAQSNAAIPPVHSPEAAMGAAAEINPGMKMFGIEQMLGGGINESGAIPSAPAPSQVPALSPPSEDITVEGFKPKKMNFWKYLGDNLLRHWGAKPVFQERVDRENLSRALEGITNDPMSVIGRINSFNPELAYKLYGQMRDDQRGDMAQQRLLGKDRESILAKATGLLGRHNAQNYPIIRQVYNNMLSRNGFDDVAPLPEEYDPDLLDVMYTGGMTPTQQEMDKYRDIRAQQQNRSLDIRQQNTDSLVTSRENANNNRNARTEIARTNANRPRGGGGGQAPAQGGRKVKTKYGIGEVSPSGQTMTVKIGNKTAFYRSTGSDTWELITVR